MDLDFDAPALLEEAMGFTNYDASNPGKCTPTLKPPAPDASHPLVAGAVPVTHALWSSQEAVTDAPFTLSGAPVTAPPRSYPNQPIAYCAKFDNQATPQPLTTQINLDTAGLIQDPVLNSGTTLRTVSEPGVTFRLVFIAFHKGLWSDSTPQVSLFFSGQESGKTVYTHVCIPVVYTTNDVDTNLFLTSWLKGSKVTSGLTVNNLLDAKNGLKFQVLYYCLGSSSAWNSYNLFLSSEPLLLNQNGLPSWLQNDLTMSGTRWVSNTTYRMKTFSDFYTYAMNVRNPDYTQFLNWGSIRTADTTTKKTFTSILDTGTQSVIAVSYYSLASGALSGTAFKQTTQRTLPKKQIKCYPINLMKHVDKDGNVIVDSNNVPQTTSDAKNNAQGATLDVKLDPATVQAQNNTAVLIFAVLIGVLAGIFVLAVVFYVFASAREAGAAAAVTAAGAAATAGAATAATGAAGAGAGAGAATTGAAAASAPLPLVTPPTVFQRVRGAFGQTFGQSPNPPTQLTPVVSTP